MASPSGISFIGRLLAITLEIFWKRKEYSSLIAEVRELRSDRASGYQYGDLHPCGHGPDSINTSVLLSIPRKAKNRICYAYWHVF